MPVAPADCHTDFAAYPSLIQQQSVWSSCSVWSPVVICCTAVRTLISTNKFVLDTNDSFVVSTAVGYTNERQQSPHRRGRFVSSNSDKCEGRGRKTLDPLSWCWVKGGFFKGRRRRRRRRREVKRDKVIPRRILFVFMGVD